MHSAAAGGYLPSKETPPTEGKVSSSRVEANAIRKTIFSVEMDSAPQVFLCSVYNRRKMIHYSMPVEHSVTTKRFFFLFL